MEKEINKITFNSLDELIDFNKSINENKDKKYYDITLKDNQIKKIEINLCFIGKLTLNCNSLSNIRGNFDIDELNVKINFETQDYYYLILNLNTTIKKLNIYSDKSLSFYNKRIKLIGSYLNLKYLNVVKSEYNNYLYHRGITSIFINSLIFNDYIIFNDKYKLYKDYNIESIKSYYYENSENIISFYNPEFKTINDKHKKLIGYFDNDITIKNNKNEIKPYLILDGSFKKINGNVETLILDNLKYIDINSDIHFQNLILNKSLKLNEENIKIINELIKKQQKLKNVILNSSTFPLKHTFDIENIYYINNDNFISSTDEISQNINFVNTTYFKSIFETVEDGNNEHILTFYSNPNDINNIDFNDEKNIEKYIKELNDKNNLSNLTIDKFEGSISKLELYSDNIDIKNYKIGIWELHLYNCKNFILENFGQQNNNFYVKKIFIHNDDENLNDTNKFLYFINLIKYFINNKNVEIYFNDINYNFIFDDKNIKNIDDNTIDINNKDSYYIFKNNNIKNIKFNNNEKIIINGEINEDNINLYGNVDILELKYFNVNSEILDFSNLKINKQLIITGNYPNLKGIICNNIDLIILNIHNINEDLIINKAKYILIDKNNTTKLNNYNLLPNIIFGIGDMCYKLYNIDNIYDTTKKELEFNINDYSIFKDLELKDIIIDNEKNYKLNDYILKGKYNNLEKIYIYGDINNLELNGDFENSDFYININGFTKNKTNIKFIGTYKEINYIYIEQGREYINNLLFENFICKNDIYLNCNTIFIKNVDVNGLIISVDDNLKFIGDFSKVDNIFFGIITNKENNYNIELNGNFSNLKVLKKCDDTICNFNSLYLNSNNYLINELIIENSNYKELKLSGNYENIEFRNCNCKIIYDNYNGDCLKIFSDVDFLNNVNFNQINIDGNFKKNIDKYNISGKVNIINDIQIKQSNINYLIKINKYINNIKLIIDNNYSNVDNQINKIICYNNISSLSIINSNIKEIPDNLLLLKELKLYSCKNIFSIPDTLINLKSLLIYNCDNINFIPTSFNKLKHLHLEKCNINYVNLLNYPNLNDVKLFGIKQIDNFDMKNYKIFVVSNVNIK